MPTHKRIKSILISQPLPSDEGSPYHNLKEKWNLKMDFRKFIQIEGVSTNEFRKQNVSPLSFTAVIFTSRNAVDHFFRMAQEMRANIPETMKYFCVSESTAYYLQKYVVYRKRKIFHGKQKFEDLLDVIKKHKQEKFLFPCSDIHDDRVTEKLEALNVKFSKAILYRTVVSDLSDLENVYYDMLVFFSPSGIESLFKNFPDFKQNDTKLAAFGPTTEKAVLDAGLRLDVYAPLPKAPSMSMAIEQFIISNK